MYNFFLSYSHFFPRSVISVVVKKIEMSFELLPVIGQELQVGLSLNFVNAELLKLGFVFLLPLNDLISHSEIMEKKDEEKYGYLKYAGVPFAVAVAPVLGYLIGSWLDKHLNTTPYLTFFFLLAGIASGIREVYKVVKEFNKNDDE